MNTQGTFILPGTAEGFPVEGMWVLGFEVCVGIQEAEHAQRAPGQSLQRKRVH